MANHGKSENARMRALRAIFTNMMSVYETPLSSALCYLTLNQAQNSMKLGSFWIILPRSLEHINRWEGTGRSYCATVCEERMRTWNPSDCERATISPKMSP